MSNNSNTPVEGEWMPSEEEIEAFEEKANEIFEAFLESMKDDPKYIRPYDSDEDPSEGQDCQWMWSDRAMRLIDHIQSRLYKLAEKKFGAWVIDITIESHLYREF